MTYEEIEVTSFDETFLHIKVDNGNGGFTSFPADNDNPAYIAFLAALQKENPKDPHFVAWVEAGNDPDEFWAQSDDFAETEEI
jgi:hypothetical protein